MSINEANINSLSKILMNNFYRMFLQENNQNDQNEITKDDVDYAQNSNRIRFISCCNRVDRIQDYNNQ